VVTGGLKSPETAAGPSDPDRRSYFEVTQFDIDGDIAFWTGFQYVSSASPGGGEPVVTKLRVTEVLRREDDQWALIHRHAGPALQ
jgi:ketosteroid isomerase-like protein